MTIARNSSRLLLTQGLALAAGLLSSIITARYLGPDGRGMMAVVTVTTNLGALFAGLGLTYSLAYFVAKERISPARGLGFALIATVILGTAVVGVVLLVAPLLSKTLLQGVSAAMLIAGIGALPASMFFEMWYAIRTATNDFATPTRLQNVNTALTVALTFVVLVLIDGGVTSLLAALAGGAYLISGFALVAGIRSTGIDFAISPKEAREILKYGFTVYLGSIVNSVYLRLDAYILNAVRGPASVGQYSTAVSLNERLWMAESALGQAVLPKVMSSERSEAARIAALTARTSFVITALPAAALAAIAPWLIPLLYGQEFTPAVLPLQLLLIGTVAYPAGKPLANYFSGQLGRPKVTSTIAAVIAAVSIGMFALLIPEYGASGAALASSIVYVGATVFLVWFFARETRMTMRKVVMPTRADLEVYRHVIGRGIASMRSALKRG